MLYYLIFKNSVVFFYIAYLVKVEFKIKDISLNLNLEQGFPNFLGNGLL